LLNVTGPEKVALKFSGLIAPPFMVIGFAMMPPLAAGACANSLTQFTVTDVGVVVLPRAAVPAPRGRRR
jgi:hypothetical protein